MHKTYEMLFQELVDNKQSFIDYLKEWHLSPDDVTLQDISNYCKRAHRYLCEHSNCTSRILKLFIDNLYYDLEASWIEPEKHIVDWNNIIIDGEVIL